MLLAIVSVLFVAGFSIQHPRPPSWDAEATWYLGAGNYRLTGSAWGCSDFDDTYWIGHILRSYTDRAFEDAEQYLESKIVFGDCVHLGEGTILTWRGWGVYLGIGLSEHALDHVGCAHRPSTGEGSLTAC